MLLTRTGLDLFQTGCYADQICIAVMMVINLKHLESSRAEALSLPCFKLLHNGAYCSQGNVMTARQAADRAVRMEKHYLCERSIKEGVRGDQGPPYFTSVAIPCSKLEAEPDPYKNYSDVNTHIQLKSNATDERGFS